MNIHISIVIPVYNGYEFFDECISSIINQTYTSWESIIGVNGHGDDSNPIFKMLQEKINKLEDKRIYIYNFSDIKGAPATINKLVSLAKYDWIAHLDIDDKWEPLKLEVQTEFINNECKGFSIIGTWCIYFGDLQSLSPVLEYGELDLKTFISKGNQLIHSSILIKKEFAHYTDEFVCYDLDCWLRCLIAGVRIFNLGYGLTYHRIHKQSFFNASNKQTPNKVFEKYVGNTPEWQHKLLLSTIYQC